MKAKKISRSAQQLENWLNWGIQQHLLVRATATDFRIEECARQQAALECTKYAHSEKDKDYYRAQVIVIDLKRVEAIRTGAVKSALEAK